MNKKFYIQNKDRIQNEHFRTYEEMYYFSEYRKSVLLWYPFKNNSNILHIGSGIGILTDFLKTKGTVVSVEENKDLNTIQNIRNPNINIYFNIDELFINNYYHSFDYIVVEGFLDKIDEKKLFLGSILQLLKNTGEILILTNNKLALKYFNGAIEETTNTRFGNLLKKNNLFSKKEWEALLDEVGVKYRFYYPFPNYAFTTQIFSDSFSNEQITFKELPYQGTKIEVFDELKAYDTLNKSGYFKDFSNSFFIVINTNINIEYSKISKERKKRYQIFTNISDLSGKKIVEKVAIDEEGISHLKDICDYYNLICEYNESQYIKYCNVNMVQNKLVFDYINGTSLETMVRKELDQGNTAAVFKYLNIVDEIASIGEKCIFYNSNEFRKIFGNIDTTLFEGLECYSFSNIDLIFENIIVNDYYNVIDYEWVLKCTVPKKFIIYRTILHSNSLSLLNKEDLQKVYNKFGIDLELQKVFYLMEITFQNYVSGNTISKTFEELDLPLIRLQEIESKFGIISIEQEEATFNHAFGNQGSFHVETVCKKGKVKIKFDKKVIISIKSIAINGKSINYIDTNANMIIGNNYYFLDAPFIEFQSEMDGYLLFEGVIYYYNDDCIDNIVDLLSTISNLKDDLDNLRKYRLVRWIEKMGD